MIDIPTEIWLYITQFIPHDTLRDLLSVNRVFFDVAMNIRYNQVRINDLGPHTRQLLTRLMDPVVARRVHRLNVCPSYRKEFGSKKDTVSEGSVTSVASIRQQLYTMLRNGSLPAMPGPTRSPVASSSKPRFPLEDVIAPVIEIIPGLVNVTEFTVDSWYLPPGYDVQPFFTAAWLSFGHNLRKLSLGGNLEGYRAFAMSLPQNHLRSVQVLNLEFANNQFLMDDAADGKILLEDVLPFVNGLNSQLRSLKISSWATLDLSSFFASLDPFSGLQRLSIRAAFNNAFRTDPSGLTRFLCDNSATLQSVELRLNPTGSAIDPNSEQVLSQWMSEGITKPAMLANLQTLHIYPTLRSEGLDALAEYLRRSSDTLNDLIVRDRYLLYDEVEVLVGGFGHRSSEQGLKSLRLNVRTLTVELIDLLAETLPGLETLALYIGDEVTTDNASTIETFQTKIQGRLYENWRLYDIGLWQGGSELNYEVMQLLARCIPTVRSFWNSKNTQEIRAVPTSPKYPFGGAFYY